MNRQTCVDCGAMSPPTETNYTLISKKHGWRLTRWTDANGLLHLEWRCPSCWSESKRDKDLLKTAKAERAEAEHRPAKRRHSTMPPAKRR